jgi:hypothetical protein
MRAQYYFKEDDVHWAAFFRRHLEYEMLPPEGYIAFINSRLVAYDARILTDDTVTISDFGKYTYNPIIGIEFPTNEDMLHFLLIYN